MGDVEREPSDVVMDASLDKGQLKYVPSDDEIQRVLGEIPEKLIAYIMKRGSKMQEVKSDLTQIISNVASDDEMHGVGMIVSKKIGGITIQAGTRGASAEYAKVDFKITDGEAGHVVECAIHNCEDSPDSVEFDRDDQGRPVQTLDEVNNMISESIDQGKLMRITGHYANERGARKFFVTHMEEYGDMFLSQLTDKDVEIFLKLCDQFMISPFDVMTHLIFLKFRAHDYIKKSMLLWGVSPLFFEETLHMIVISAPAEGKDYLIRQIMSKVVPIGIAESKSVSTLAALVGAMGSDDLTMVDVGLLARYNHQRVAVIEFETWDDQMWGALLGAMANGEFYISKGKVTGRRRECELNFLLMGNPREDYSYDRSDKFVALEAFGEHLKKILSRLALVFNELSLAPISDEDDFVIEDLISDNIRNKIKRKKEGPGLAKNMTMDYIYAFFREYFKYITNSVFTDVPEKDSAVYAFIKERWFRIQSLPGVGRILRPVSDKKRDKRKWIQFMNIIRYVARINGREEILESDVRISEYIYLKSLETIVSNLDIIESVDRLTDIDRAIVDHLTQNPEENNTSQIRTGTGKTNPKHYQDLKASLDKLVDMKILSKEKIQGRAGFCYVLQKSKDEIGADLDEMMSAVKKAQLNYDEKMKESPPDTLVQSQASKFVDFDSDIETDKQSDEFKSRKDKDILKDFPAEGEKIKRHRKK